jgi:hypothetical protein
MDQIIISLILIGHHDIASPAPTARLEDILTTINHVAESETTWRR